MQRAKNPHSLRPEDQEQYFGIGLLYPVYPDRKTSIVVIGEHSKNVFFNAYRIIEDTIGFNCYNPKMFFQLSSYIPFSFRFHHAELKSSDDIILEEETSAEISKLLLMNSIYKLMEQLQQNWRENEK